MAGNLRGSMSGLMSETGVLYSTDQSGCFRWILLRYNGIEQTITEKSKKIFMVGHANEDIYERNHLQRIKHEKEFEISDDITDSVKLEGHIDFITYEPKTIYELKSITSEITLKEIEGTKKKQGKPKYNNLAQLVRYMVSTNTERGFLIYSSYFPSLNSKTISSLGVEEIEKRLGYSNPKNFSFEVTFGNEGEILTNGNDTKVSIFDVMRHTKYAAYVVTNNVLHPARPKDFSKIGTDSRYSSCFFCPLNDTTCYKVDSGDIHTAKEFIRDAEIVLKMGTDIAEVDFESNE